jgi:hypothetical protein
VTIVVGGRGSAVADGSPEPDAGTGCGLGLVVGVGLEAGVAEGSGPIMAA